MPLSRLPHSFTTEGSTVMCIILIIILPACHLNRSHYYSNHVASITKTHNCDLIALTIIYLSSYCSLVVFW